MTKQKYLLIAFMMTIFLSGAAVASAQDLIPTPGDVAPGTMSYGNVAHAGLDPNIMAAIIGVCGLLVGSFLTILGTYFLRFLDVRREDKREEAFMERERKEKEFQMKQEIYKNFLTELGTMESFLVHKSENSQLKDMNGFNSEWSKMEIKMSLVCSPKIRKLLDEMQSDLLIIAKKRFQGSEAELDDNYTSKRGELLDAIREDIDLFA